MEIALKRFKGRSRIHAMYFDWAPEFEDACNRLAIPVDASQAGRPSNDAIVECLNQDMLQGTRVSLLQAGLPPPLWHLAMPCYCQHSNALTVEGTSPWYKRHHKHFDGLLIPFGARVYYKPLPTSAQGENDPKFAPVAIPGIFLRRCVSFSLQTQ